jgi:hypothetical protein
MGVVGAAVVGALVLTGPALALPDDPTPDPQGPIDHTAAVPKPSDLPELPTVDPTPGPHDQTACLISLCPPPPSSPVNRV